MVRADLEKNSPRFLEIVESNLQIALISVKRTNIGQSAGLAHSIANFVEDLK